MPWGYVAGGAASALVGSVLGGGGNGGSSGGNAPPVYIPADQAGADANFLANKDQYQSTLQGQYNTTNPANSALLQGQLNNPYAASTQDFSNYAAAQYQNASNMENAGTGRAWANTGDQYNNAIRSDQMIQGGLGKVQQSTTDLYNMAGQSNQNYQSLMNYQQGQLPNIQNSQNNLYNSGNQVLNTAFDPQNALYNQQQQLNTDQSRASEYARGVQSSPYGAALENQSNQNFNLNWQNQQLARQTQGLSAAQGAYGSAQGMGNSYTGTQAGLQAGQNEQYAGLTNAAQNQWTNYINAGNQSAAMTTQTIGAANQNAMNLANQGAQSAYNAGQVPYQTNQQMYGNQNQALQNYQGNNTAYMQGLNQLQSNDLGYMNGGQSAQNQAFNQNSYNNQQTQQAVGSLAGPIGNAVQNTNWSQLANTASNWFSGSDSNASLSAGPLY